MTNRRGARAVLLTALLAGTAFAAEAGVTLTSSLDFGDALVTTAGNFAVADPTTYVFVYDPAPTSAVAGNWYSPVSVTVPNAGAAAHASGSATIDNETATIVDLVSSVNVDRYGEVTLAAGQNIIFTVPYTLAFSLTGGSAAIGEADVQLQLLTADANGNFTNIARMDQAQLSGAGSASNQLAINFTNTSASAVTYRLAYNANASVSAVPEPSSPALMFAGLAGVAALAARRRQR